MYERFIPNQTILDQFERIENTSIDEIRENTNKDTAVDLRDRFYAFAYLNEMGIDEMVSITGRTRPNFYHSYHKPRFKEYLKKYRQSEQR